VHKENAASKHIFISKVEEGSKLATAGVQAGMRIITINDRPCPETFLDMVKLMTVKVAVFPKDLERQKGDLQGDSESPLPENENVRLSPVEGRKY
jgi:predicted metalloprotease with PDZ domain